MYTVHRLQNPIKRSYWPFIGAGAVAVGLGVWWMSRSTTAAASAQLGPATTFETGGKYQITGPLPAGSDPSFSSSIQASYTAAGAVGPQWKDVTVTTSGFATSPTYTVTGTYIGPGMSIPAGLTVTRIG